MSKVIIHLENLKGVNGQNLQPVTLSVRLKEGQSLAEKLFVVLCHDITKFKTVSMFEKFIMEGKGDTVVLRSHPQGEEDVKSYIIDATELLIIEHRKDPEPLAKYINRKMPKSAKVRAPIGFSTTVNYNLFGKVQLVSLANIINHFFDLAKSYKEVGASSKLKLDELLKLGGECFDMVRMYEKRDMTNIVNVMDELRAA